MSFKKRIEDIRHKNVHQASAQDWDVKEFIDTVIEYAEMGRTRREQYRGVLVDFFERFKSDIRDYLLGRDDGPKWGNFVSEALFGRPWDLRAVQKKKTKVASVKFERNIVTTIMSFPRKHPEKLEEALLSMKPFSAVKLGREIKNLIVEDVQAALKSKNERSVLMAVLGQKELIRQALYDLLESIIRSERVKDVPDSEKELFVDPIFKKIILEIEAKIALLHKASAA